MKILSLRASNWVSPLLLALGLVLLPALPLWAETIQVATLKTPTSNWKLSRILLGTVRAEREILVSSEIFGLVSSPRMEQGTLVRQGELLVGIDDRIVRAERRLAEAKVRAASANVLLNQSQYQRLLVGHRADTLSDYELELSHNTLVSAQANLTITEEQLNVITLKLESYKLLAPFDGILQTATPEKGVRVIPGELLFTLWDTSQSRISISLTPEERRLLDRGELELFPTTRKTLIKPLYLDHQPSLTSITLAAGANPNTGMIAAEFRFPSQLALQPGEIVKINALRRVTEIQIPETAYHRSSDDVFVYVVRDGIVQRMDARNHEKLFNQEIIVLAPSGIEVGDLVNTIPLDG